MSTEDITRLMYDARKRYIRTHMQAGRIIADADWNDETDITAEDRRRAIRDIVGAYGSPDDGFRVTNIHTTNGSLDFDILAGTLYVGGLRLQLDEATTYQTQPDLLQLQTVTPPAQNSRHDLVLIEAFESPVSGVEDAELLDPALGGVDTAQRLLRHQRVLIIPDIGALTCDQAFQNVIAMLNNINAGTINANYERVVDTRLTVTYTDEGTDDDLCEPPLTGGYLGAENTAIRVQLVDDEHFTWGFDNAAPLYRVSMAEDRLELTMITMPRDEYSTPQDGQVIEILAWNTLLPNDEKTAALSGHLTRIDTVDTNDDGTITLTLADAVPTAEFENWKNRPDVGVLDDDIYYFMRIWNRGADVGSSPAINFTPGTPVTLGTTGIEVTFTGDDYVREDYWVIAARPETPTQVLPWELETGLAPHGVRRFFAPLALIHWHSGNTIDIDDCRPPFHALTELRGCCTFSVGDGVKSHGDFDNLQDAIDAIPMGGGQICLLPGLHYANAELVNRNNLTIDGCGTRSMVLPKDGGDVFQIVNSNAITITNLNVVTVDGSGIVARQTDRLRIADVNVLASEVGIDADDMQEVTIERCIIRILDKDEGDVGIYAQGDDLHIEGCHIQVIPNGILPEPPDDDDPDTPPIDPTDPCAEPDKFYANVGYLVYYVEFVWSLWLQAPQLENEYLALGGIQIGSGSELVLVKNNEIIGGSGNGITLGSDIADVLSDDLVDQPPENGESFFFTHDADTIRGSVFYNNQAIGGMTIFFDDGNTIANSFAVNSFGSFGGEMQPGTYRVYVSDNSLRVGNIEPLDSGIYRVTLEAIDDVRPNPLLDLVAFIYDVTLADNSISYMGMSGIGVPILDEEDLSSLQKLSGSSKVLVAQQMFLLVYLLTGTVTGFVVDLVIVNNRIKRCLRNVVIVEALNFLVERGNGGISLALSDGLTIAENIVENCGRGVEMPVCGIFNSFAIDLTIKDNHILNNGHAVLARDVTSEFTNNLGSANFTTNRGQPMNARANYSAYRDFRVMDARVGLSAVVAPTATLRPGPRGAIVVPICMSANAFAGVNPQDRAINETSYVTSFASGRHAARIEGNYVVQPLGKTIFLGAMGSVSITDNQLTSDIALSRELDVRAGGLTGAFGGVLQFGNLDLFSSNVLIMNLGTGAYVPAIFSSMSTNSDFEQFEGPIPLGYPDGNILFDSNQVKQGDAGARKTIITLLSLDDVSMSNNQIDIFNGDFIESTAVLFAASTRASNNRLKEPVGAILSPQSDIISNIRSRFSIVSVNSLSGNMINNQGHYCFITLSSNMAAVSEIANHTMLANLLDCPKTSGEDIPSISTLFLVLTLISAGFALGLSRQDT